MALSSSGTAIEHFQAELRQTNICSVTRKLSVGIVYARVYALCQTTISEYSADLLCLFACFDRKVSSIFFTHFITKCKSTSLSIECCRRLIAWLVKLIKEWASRLPAISLNEKIPRHSQLFSWEKKINLKEKWDAKVYIFCSLTAAPAVFIYILQAKSSASASFILTEGTS